MNIDGFSIVTITKRKNCISRLIKNFLGQVIPNKELIVVINNDSISIKDFYLYTNLYNNIQVYKLSQNISLGMCLNYACSKSKYNIICKFDDDDYYSPYYLKEAESKFLNYDCDIVGKLKAYVYLSMYNMLLLKVNKVENDYVTTVLGSTICFKKSILDDVKFKDVNCLEDKYFNSDCLKLGYKIYSSSRYNHIIYKHKDPNEHTFASNIPFLIKTSKIIESNVSFYDCFKIVDENKKMS
ncbi:glycosyltransferase [Romboutsia lituseburensis]|uniref:glycosyltransferase n=1 Tax=Romboutsia lituseburensis TaxID=1537 RepID=UPI00215A19B1|nr:glycosyltransferase [Romboutsia lituseburensis]MCR8744701.1 glycosyltransferase [Romboutsia lituseburensis]